MTRWRSWATGAAVAGASAIILGLGVTALVGDKDGMPITGADRDRATAVALEFAGGGQVLEAEVGEPQSHFTIEVAKPDGSVVEVGLDENFRVTRHAERS